MYEYWLAVIIGILEGLTEYIPVSSTGHMIIVGDMLGFSGDKASVFEVFIQLGAIFSVLIVYKERFMEMFSRERIWSKSGISWLNLAIAMLPAMAFGYCLHRFIKTYLFGWETVVVGLVVGALLMLWAEKRPVAIETDSVDEMTVKQALLIGLFQVLSLWPGFSRSGSTISGGMIVGVSRRAAPDFSFIMAVPLMTIACGYDLLKIWHLLTINDLGVFAVGLITAFLVAYVSVLWFLRFLHRLGLTGFAYYRMVLAVLVTIYFTY